MLADAQRNRYVHQQMNHSQTRNSAQACGKRVKPEIGTVRVVGSLTEDREGNKELRCLCGLLLGSRATKLPQ
jgi:hypothetical protein